jgi:hypothetical protein
MEEDLKDLIKESRRKLGWASGVPQTAEEQKDVRRKAEIEKLELFLSKVLGFRISLALPFKVIWTDHGATAQMTLDGHRFHLFKDHDEFYFLSDLAEEERELLRMRGSDPNFADRVLVAIDDRLLNTETRT